MTTGVVGLLAVVAGLTVPPSPAAAADDGGTLLWGAHPNTRVGETEAAAHQRVRATAGRDLEAVRMFYLWDEDTTFRGAVEQRVLDSGGTLVVSVKPQNTAGATISWADVADAAPGSAIHDRMVSWAQQVAAVGAPVYVTFHHEPEAQANLGYGTAADYLAAWRAWTTVFREAGASNARFQWIMTDQSFWLPAGDRRAAQRWYPGDAWVDSIASDAYNWFQCRTGISNPWKSLEQIIEPQRRFWLDHQDEELWLTEYGTVEDPAQPGRKAQWFRDAQALFATPEYAVFDGVMLFESVPRSTCRWSADTSAASATAWAAWGADPHYGATQPPGPSPDPEPEPEPPSVVVVTADPAAPGVDAALRTRLTAAGYDVRLADDHTVTPAGVADADAVLVSSTVSQAALRDRLRSTPLPLVVWKPSVLDDLGLSPGADGSSVRTRQVGVVDAAHPLSAGLSGTVTVTSTLDRLPVASPGPSAEVVAHAGGAATLFSYAAGAALEDGDAAGCRIAAPVPPGGVAVLTADGSAVLDRAVSHALAGCP